MARTDGTRVAGSFTVKGSIAVTLLLPTGCLITDPVEFQPEPDFPLSIVTSNSSPQPRTDELLTSGLPAEGFSVRVRDPNVDDPVNWAVFVDFARLLDASSIVTLDPEDPSIRIITFELTERQVDPTNTGGCFAIELRVSSSGFNTYCPRVPGDLAQAIWWTSLPAGGAIPMSDCNPSEGRLTCP